MPAAEETAGVSDESAADGTRVGWSSRRTSMAVFAAVLVAGVFCGLGTPPFSGFDEVRHFAHAWQVSDGRILPLDGRTPTGSPAQGGFLPSGVARDIVSLHRIGRARDPARLVHSLNDPAGGGRPEFTEFSNVASYSALSYLPAAIAIRIGRWFGASTLLLLVLARIFGLTAYAALAALAVRRVPTRRALMALVLLTPVAIVQASTVSADGITTGLAILLVAEALRLAAQPRGAVTRAACVEAGIVLIALALAKPPYVLFGLLYLVAMVRQRGFVAKTLVGAGSVGAALAAAWNAWSAQHYVQQYFGLVQLDPHYYAFRGVNSTRQLEYVAAHPWVFPGIVGRTILDSGWWIVHDMVLQSPAWQGLPGLTTAIELCILVGAVVVAVDEADISSVRAIGAVAAGLTAIAVFLLAYAGWNELRAPRIDALDGRYFFPVLALTLLVVIPARGHRWSEPTRRVATRTLLAAQFVFVLCVAAAAIHNTYGASDRPLQAAPMTNRLFHVTNTSPSRVTTTPRPSGSTFVNQR
jgi:uncharacterized membrane protein